MTDPEKPTRTAERWRVELSGDSSDLLAVRAAFSSSDPSALVLGERTILSTSQLDVAQSSSDARSVAEKIVNDINLALQSTDSFFRPITSTVLLEWTGTAWRKHYQMVLEAARYRIELSPLKAVTSGDASTPPKPTLAETVYALINSRPELRDVSRQISHAPPRWADLYAAFETLKAVNSAKGRRDDYQALIAKGWVSKEELDRFRDSANFEERHGHPKDPRKHAPLSLDEGAALIRRLFRLTVEDLTSDPD